MKTVPNPMWLMVAFCALLSTGCVKLWQENLDIKTYMVEADRDSAPVEKPRAKKLWVDSVSVLPPYNVRNLILRESDVEFSTSYYSELLMTPSENFRNEFYTWMDASGIFREVSIAHRSGMSHRLVVNIIEFYGDNENHQALLKIKVTLFDEQTDAFNILMNTVYSERIQVEEEGTLSVNMLIRGYNTALKKILTECELEIIRVLDRP